MTYTTFLKEVYDIDHEPQPGILLAFPIFLVIWKMLAAIFLPLMRA